MSLGVRVVERKALTRQRSRRSVTADLRLDDAFKYNIYFLQHISQTPREFHLRIIKREKRLQGERGRWGGGGGGGALQLQPFINLRIFGLECKRAIARDARCPSNLSSNIAA